MMRLMISDLCKEMKTPNLKCISDSLIQGIRSKNYIPVMKRKKCGKFKLKVIEIQKIYFISLQIV